MRILVCGGRDYACAPGHKYYKGEQSKIEYQFVFNTLNNIAEEFSKEYNEHDNWLPTDIVIIQGCAEGVDLAADDWSIVNYSQRDPYPADWNKHKKAAGSIRNQQMIDEGKPDLVVAFPGGPGTADMVRRAKKAGIPVREIA